MSKFEYTAIDSEGNKKSGFIEAKDSATARRSLTKLGLKTLVVKKEKKSLNEINIPGIGSEKVKTKDLVVFTRQLATMVNAGVPLVRSINTLTEQTESDGLRKHLKQVSKDIESGESFADSLAKHPKIFNSIYVSMVRAGETGGILDEILKKLSLQQEKDAAIRGKIKSAMTYPSVILTITTGAFFFLMTTIVPKIGDIIVGLGGTEDSLPVYTKVLLAISDIMQTPAFLVGVLVGTPIAIVLFKRWTSKPTGKYQWHSILLRLPIVKTLITKVAVARFARTFASLNTAGVSIVNAMNVTAGAIGNAVIEKELKDAAKEVQAGVQLSNQLEQSKYFPPLVAQMMAVGEETGQTGEVLLKVAEFYEEEVDAFVESLSSIIEPVMIVVLGGIVGVIAASVFGPISNISQNIQ